MSIKATFPTGVDAITLSARLHQWDFGQTLEIEFDGMTAMIEAHFACAGMTEAEVRPCQAVNGVATVAIPDRCLEQSGPITAWVFETTDTQGMTTKTITIPVVARPKPMKGEAVPDSFVDQYQALIAEVNAAVKDILVGDVVVARAKRAGLADLADCAAVISTHSSPLQSVIAEAEHYDDGGDMEGDLMHLVPSEDNCLDLGKEGQRFRKVYTKGLVTDEFNTDAFKADAPWIEGRDQEELFHGIYLVKIISDHSVVVLDTCAKSNTASGVFYGAPIEGVDGACHSRLYARYESALNGHVITQQYNTGNGWHDVPLPQFIEFRYKQISGQ